MSIRTKIMLFASLFLMLAVTVLTILSVKNIQAQGEERIVAYRVEALETAKSQLKDLVDVAYEAVDKNYQRLSDVDYLSNYYERRLNDIIDTGETIIKRYQRLAASGQMSVAQAKQRAMAEIGELRFDGGSGYIWINDTAKPFPSMIMHPTVPSLDGTVLNSIDYNNALGTHTNLFVAFVDATEGGQDGYVDYLWPKPVDGGLTEEVPKFSYVRRYEDWGWILGTGIYIDDAQIEIENAIKEAVKDMRYADGTGYFWINDNTLPYPTMIMHPTVPSLDGTVLDDPKFNNAQGVDKNLFTAFAEVTSDGDHEGFVDYLWPKPTPQGLTERTPKVSYVRLHEPSGWIIGSGVYIDNIDHVVAERRLEIEDQISELVVKSVIASLLFLAAAFVVSFIFADTLSKPIRSLTQVTKDISRGKNLAEPIADINRKDEIGDLARSVDRLKSSVRIMMDRMTKK